MLTKFATGQVWCYSTRPGEPASRITVVRVDDDEDYGNIIHIHVSDVDIPNLSAPGGKTTFIAHLPYTEEALENSVSELESQTQALPDYEEGYRLWRQAFDRGEAGAFEIPVSQAVEFVQQTIVES